MKKSANTKVKKEKVVEPEVVDNTQVATLEYYESVGAISKNKSSLTQIELFYRNINK